MSAPPWMMLNPGGKQITIGAAAVKLGCSLDRYRYMVGAGLVPGALAGGGHVDTGQLDSFLAGPRVLPARVVAQAAEGDRRARKTVAVARSLGFTEAGGNSTVTAAPVRVVAPLPPRPVAATARPVPGPKPIVVNDLADLRALGSAIGLKGFEEPGVGKTPANEDTDIAKLKALARQVGLKGFADAPDGRAA